MNDNIIDLLDLTDNDSEITDITIEGSLKTVTLMKKPCVKYCPVCRTRLHSKGRFTRRPNHQILQDGYTLEIIAIGRRWFCPNPDCSYSETDQFGFIQKRKKNSSIMDVMILRYLKDLSLSCVQIAGM